MDNESNSTFEALDDESDTVMDEFNLRMEDSEKLDVSMLERVEEATQLREIPEVLKKFRKPLDQLKDIRTKRKRTAEDFQHFLSVATKQGVTLAQLCGHFLQRNYYNSNKQLASLGTRLFEGDVHLGKLQCIDNLRAVHIISRYILNIKPYKSRQN